MYSIVTNGLAHISQHRCALLSQITFQAVLSTNGSITFVTFMYESLQQVKGIVGSGNAAVGFDGGDNSRGIIISSINEYLNIFRIDGVLVH